MKTKRNNTPLKIPQASDNMTCGSLPPALFGPSLQRGTTLWIDGLEKIIGGRGI